MNTLEKTNVFYQADRLRFIQCFRNVATHQVTTRDGNRPTTPVGNPRCPTENYFSFWKPKGEPTNRTNSPKTESQRMRFSKWFFFCLFWGGSASKKKQIKLHRHVWDDVSDSKKTVSGYWENNMLENPSQYENKNTVINLDGYPNELPNFDAFSNMIPSFVIFIGWIWKTPFFLGYQLNILLYITWINPDNNHQYLSII